jgi:hypothetical protein
MTATSSSAYQDSTRDSAALAAQVLLNRVVLSLQNRAYTAAGAAIATVTSKVKIANTVDYTIDGAWQTAVSATDNFWVLAGSVVPAANACIFLLCLDAAGAEHVVQSSIAATVAACNFNLTGANTTSQIDALCVVSYLTITMDATHTFTPGTTLLGATGVTAVIADGVPNNFLPVLTDANGGLQVWRAGTGPNQYL